MAGHTDDGVPDMSSTQTTTAVTGARPSVAPLTADGLPSTSCKHERASGRLRLSEDCLIGETTCDACGAVLHSFPPVTYRMPSMTSPMPAERLVA
jgi:hypothetical protein